MMTYSGALYALWAGLVGVAVSVVAYPCQAELATAAFGCAVQMFSVPNGAPSRVLIRTEPGKMKLVVVMTPPYVNEYVLVGDSKAGLVGVSTDSHYYLHEPGVTASMILIDRLTGALRWMEARADTGPSMIGEGTCVDAH